MIEIMALMHDDKIVDVLINQEDIDRWGESIRIMEECGYSTMYRLVVMEATFKDA